MTKRITSQGRRSNWRVKKTGEDGNLTSKVQIGDRSVAANQKVFDFNLKYGTEHFDSMVQGVAVII